jgi:hypothetical protein
VPFVAEPRRFVARGEDKIEITAVGCPLVFLHSGWVDLL